MVNTALDTSDALAYLERQEQTGWPDLTDQERGFAYEYVISYDHRRAAKKVGISKSRALATLRNPLVSAFIGSLQKSQHVTNVITEDFVRAQYLNILPMLRGDVEVPVVLANGYVVNVKKFHSSEFMGALRELGKSTKFYEDGSGQGGLVKIDINLGAVMSEQGVTIEGEIDE